MKDDNAKRLRANRVWLTADSCDLGEFKEPKSSGLAQSRRLSLRRDAVVERARL